MSCFLSGSHGLLLVRMVSSSKPAYSLQAEIPPFLKSMAATGYGKALAPGGGRAFFISLYTKDLRRFL